MSNATRFRILHNIPAHQVDQGRDVSLLRGTVVVTEADHTREIDALAAEIERLRAMNNALRANAEYGIRERDFLAARVAELERGAARWIGVEERLPEPGVTVMVYTPPQPGDYPNDIRISLDGICPESDGGYWIDHGEHYEHWCCIAKGGAGIEWHGPSEKAPYTHWMPLPAVPSAPSQALEPEIGRSMP